jgi:hypothetical protein
MPVQNAQGVGAGVGRLSQSEEKTTKEDANLIVDVLDGAPDPEVRGMAPSRPAPSSPRATNRTGGCSRSPPPWCWTRASACGVAGTPRP